MNKKQLEAENAYLKTQMERVEKDLHVAQALYERWENKLSQINSIADKFTALVPHLERGVQDRPTIARNVRTWRHPLMNVATTEGRIWVELLNDLAHDIEARRV